MKIDRQAIEQEIKAYRKGKSWQHRDGVCGGYADLCSDCHKNEYDVMLKHARKVPAISGETMAEYMHRSGLPYYDTWHEVCREIIKEAEHRA